MDCATHTVRVPNLPKELAGLRVAQLTDLHRGRLTSDDLIRRAVAHVCAWRPDLILLTGDFVDSDPADIGPCMRLIAPLTAACQAVYAVPGNHDAKAGLEQVQTALRGEGIVFLKNQNVRLAYGLWIVGLDEDYHGRPDIAQAFAGMEPNAPALVMAHNPGEADLLTCRACVIFSGHTHGGQINVPFFTARQLRRIKAKNYRAGWYDVGQARLYVNRGVGNTEVPFRFRCPPEAALFILQPAT